MKKGILIVPVLLASTSIAAQEIPASIPASKWNGEAELGFVKTTGNTDTDSLHGKGKVINERNQWRHTGTLEAVNNSDSGIRTAERYFVTGKSDYKFGEKSYLFVMLSYEDDHFSGYDYQLSETIGYGFNAIKKNNLKLDLEAGVGARQSKLDLGDSTNEGTLKGAANLDWKISESATFTQSLSIEAGEDITISRSVSALKLQIIGSLAAKLSYNVKNTSEVPPGFDKTDTESIVTLVYSF